MPIKAARPPKLWGCVAALKSEIVPERTVDVEMISGRGRAPPDVDGGYSGFEPPPKSKFWSRCRSMHGASWASSGITRIARFGTRTTVDAGTTTPLCEELASRSGQDLLRDVVRLIEKLRSRIPQPVGIVPAWTAHADYVRGVVAGCVVPQAHGPRARNSAAQANAEQAMVSSREQRATAAQEIRVMGSSVSDKRSEDRTRPQGGSKGAAIRTSACRRSAPLIFSGAEKRRGAPAPCQRDGEALAV